MRLSHHTIKAGSRSKRLLLFLRSASDRSSGATGLRPRTPGATAAYVRDGDVTPRPVPLVEATPDDHRPGGFAEVDPDLLPGVYRFDCPDEMLAEGATRALLLLRFPGVAVEPIEVALVAYDPQDEERIGVEGLSDGRRHAFLRRALPRLTEMELALGQEAERRLADREGDRID